jgi:hypothetical protein
MKKEMKKMRYEIKYWKLDDDEEYITLCKNKNEVISILSGICMDGRIEYINVSDLKRGGDF